VCVGGGAIVRALAHFTLGDGPSVGTLGSGVVGDCGGTTLVMVCQWCSDLLCLGGELGEGYHIVFEWLVCVQPKHW
jgi:hypothetical protein